MVQNYTEGWRFWATMVGLAMIGLIGVVMVMMLRV